MPKKSEKIQKILSHGKEPGSRCPKRYLKVDVFWTTPGYVDYVWTARKGVSLELKTKFMEAFLKLQGNNPKHNEVLALQGAAKFVKASSNDFDAIEQVGFSTGLLK